MIKKNFFIALTIVCFCIGRSVCSPTGEGINDTKFQEVQKKVLKELINNSKLTTNENAAMTFLSLISNFDQLVNCAIFSSLFDQGIKQQEIDQIWIKTHKVFNKQKIDFKTLFANYIVCKILANKVLEEYQKLDREPLNLNLKPFLLTDSEIKGYLDKLYSTFFPQNIKKEQNQMNKLDSTQQYKNFIQETLLFFLKNPKFLVNLQNQSSLSVPLQRFGLVLASEYASKWLELYLNSTTDSTKKNAACRLFCLAPETLILTAQRALAENNPESISKAILAYTMATMKDKTAKIKLKQLLETLVAKNQTFPFEVLLKNIQPPNFSSVASNSSKHSGNLQSKKTASPVRG